MSLVLMMAHGASRKVNNEDDENEPPSCIPISHSRRATVTLEHRPSMFQSHNQVSHRQSIPHEPSFSTIITSSLPCSIWDSANPWVAPAPGAHSYEMDEFTSTIYQAATHRMDSVPNLTLEAGSLDELVDQLSELIDEAGRNNDSFHPTDCSLSTQVVALHLVRVSRGRCSSCCGIDSFTTKVSFLSSM